MAGVTVGGNAFDPCSGIGELVALGALIARALSPALVASKTRRMTIRAQGPALQSAFLMDKVKLFFGAVPGPGLRQTLLLPSLDRQPLPHPFVILNGIANRAAVWRAEREARSFSCSDL